MHAIGIERREGGFRRIIAAQFEPRLAAFVPHQKFAARADRGQRDHQGREHAGRFFGVAMAYEEAALVIDKQLVEFGRDRFCQPEARGDTRENRLERLRPLLATDMHPLGRDLPGAPHRGVDYGFCAATVGRPLCGGHQMHGLCR